MRIPSHLRKHAQDFALEQWVEANCDPEPFYNTIDRLTDMLQANHSRAAEEGTSEEALVNLVAQVLHHEGLLEDYVLTKDVSGYKLNEEGAMLPFLEVAAILIVRRYRRAVDRGDWTPDGGDEE